MRSNYAVALAGLLISVCPGQSAAQEFRGRVIDATNDDPVPLTAVLLLDSQRLSVASVLADSLGRFRLEIPAAGSYYLSAERFGYIATVSPLLAVSDSGVYQVDLEVRPDPFQLDPLKVVVRNEEMERWLTLRGQQGNPNALFGYRSIQGTTLNQARFKARDNTDFFRWLFIPVSHGRGVCISIKGGCARVFVDDRWLPSEQIESIDLTTVVAVVALPLDTGPELHIFTVAFDFSGVRRR